MSTNLILINDVIKTLRNEFYLIPKNKTFNNFFEVCHPDAVFPTRGTNEAAGYDFYSVEDYTLQPGERHAFETGIKSHFEMGNVLILKSRSGMAYRNWVDTEAGVIDADYNQTIKVILHNHGKEPFKVSKGDRISQGIFMPLSMQYYPLVNDKERDGGFGSTGV